MNADIASIVGYADCNRNRSILMSDSALQSFPIFEERPTLAFIEQWRQHIADTGSPETFPGVSTSKPERSANVVLLSEEIRVPTPLRPGGDNVPCPLCSPTSPKFGKGRMAYFPDDSAARFIGHACAKHYLGNNYTEAERLFRIEAKCAEYIQLWPRLQLKGPALDSVIQRIYVDARKLSQLRTVINVQAPGFSSFLYNDLVARGSLVVTSQEVGAKSHQVKGIEFLSSDFDPEGSSEKLMACRNDIRRPLPAWNISDGENDASREIIKRGNAAVRRLKDLPVLRDLIEQSAEFLNPRNLRLLEQWRASGASPFSLLTFKLDGGRVEALAESYAGRYNWSVVVPPDLLAQFPTREEIASLDLSEITT